VFHVVLGRGVGFEPLARDRAPARRACAERARPDSFERARDVAEAQLERLLLSQLRFEFFTDIGLFLLGGVRGGPRKVVPRRIAGVPVMAHPLVGARGLNQDSLFQLAWRDIHAAVSQITMAWDIQAVNAGRIQFGLPSLDPRL